jgi:hypothetical protein
MKMETIASPWRWMRWRGQDRDRPAEFAVPTAFHLSQK